MERVFHLVKGSFQMGGKPQYDEGSVIDAAVDAFWRHGYAATTINVLTEATGLSRSSLYQRFQDKDGLFQIALATYTDRVLRRMKSYEGGSARARLEALLRGLLPTGSRRPPGCLLARSCAELVDLPPEGRKAAISGMSQQRTLLESLLREAIAVGELPRGADVAALAWCFLGVMQAILDLPQAGATRSELDRMIAVAMLAWPAADIAQTRT
ncbi:TetR/AcrR family transcriptional regulator [Variovorax sp. J22G21]|uniref:TetR/AcrR family transcriptional regulator n=1 Tax=Variovorax fucosicus TaxID=3053517 RepID=UPI0025781576|nr:MULTISPECIES: TetR/AcrR family transcriptional regulator [unclassified Variovorax]MDM0040705.1 TetR/AcrR family transcriptional regulator [Variovorax sp. J22R193]MDM0062078.1 TetR/AcrR family transcriptional regulator [Variovorax sp. J22G21]